MLKHKIVFLGPVPPPYMGPSIATEIILNSRLKDSFDLIHLDTSDHRDLNTLGVLDFQNIYLALKHYALLFWLIISKRPDMVYIPISQTTAGYLRDSVFILISKLLGRKVVCHLRGGNFRNWLNSASTLTQWFVRSVHSLVDGQIVLGQCLKSLFAGIVPENRIFVVSNGRDFEDNAKLDNTNNKVRILYLANFIRTKGVLDTLRAVPNVFYNNHNVEFIFAGSNQDEKVSSEIESFLMKFPALPVKFEGPVWGKKKFDLYALSDIFVFPTYYPAEGHPWVIVEAMVAGLPIISTDQGAITESVIDGVNGFIVEKQNPQQIAEKIVLLSQNQELRTQMGQASRRLYEENFTEEKMVERMAACFNKVLNPYDVKEWYDSIVKKWGDNYIYHDKSFSERLKNVHQLVRELDEKSHFLDIGCGSGEITASVYERFRCNVIGIDVSDKMIEHCQGHYSEKNLSFELGDILNLRFPSGHFDVVLSLSVIEWLEDYERAVAEVSRVLKRGGQWIVSLPNWRSPFRKIEKLKGVLFKNSYLRYQKNRVPISEFKKVTESYGLKATESVFHVLPFHKSNLSGKFGQLFGMMCILSMRKSEARPIMAVDDSVIVASKNYR